MVYKKSLSEVVLTNVNNDGKSIRICDRILAKPPDYVEFSEGIKPLIIDEEIITGGPFQNCSFRCGLDCNMIHVGLDVDSCTFNVSLALLQSLMKYYEYFHDINGDLNIQTVVCASSKLICGSLMAMPNNAVEKCKNVWKQINSTLEFVGLKGLRPLYLVCDKNCDNCKSNAILLYEVISKSYLNLRNEKFRKMIVNPKDLPVVSHLFSINFPNCVKLFKDVGYKVLDLKKANIFWNNLIYILNQQSVLKRKNITKEFIIFPSEHVDATNIKMIIDKLFINDSTDKKKCVQTRIHNESEKLNLMWNVKKERRLRLWKMQ